MTCLTMITLQWIAVVIMMMNFHCLTGLPISDTTSTFKYELDEKLEDLLLSSCERNDLKFHTPTGTEGCIGSALNCSLTQLKVVKKCFSENTSAKFDTYDAIALLHGLIHSTSIKYDKDSSNCVCKHDSNKSDLNFFLRNLKILLQQLYSKGNSKRAIQRTVQPISSRN